MLDPKQFTIRIASEEQSLEHAKACYEVVPWRNGLTWEQFLQFCIREGENAEWFKNHAALTWVLVRKDDYDGEVYSVLQTDRKQCFIKTKSSGNGQQEEKIENGWWYNITAVVTPVKHRGQGYATHLIRLLHYMLTSPSSPGGTVNNDIPSFPKEEWGSAPPSVPEEIIEFIPKPITSVLWSDVPIEFYGDCKFGLNGKGFEYDKKLNSRLVWDLNVDQKDDDNDDQKGEWELIYEETLSEIQEILVKSVKQKVLKADNSNKTIWSHDPSTPGSLTYISKKASYIEPKPEWIIKYGKPLPIGLRLRSQDDQEDTIIIIALNNFLVEKRLLITYIHNLKSNQVESLLSALEKLIIDVGAPWTQGEIWGFNLEKDDWVKEFNKNANRNVKIDNRYGIRQHVLGICNYKQGQNVDVEMLDNQMWNWV
ncbi:uncharacterized protein L201_001296 [Kwoniella dendrophila CBS 6074]|uniref:N-acetyltransferase domain-containing protein n=1 Tax=Kwoniella dendrophila CBS 6074 TaxID=1295534 RepID=A0AAX4JNE5_9TREE